MKNAEERLSDFIDQLNSDEKPKEDEFSTDSPELKKLFQTVRQVRTLKEPTMPDANYQKRLTRSVKEKVQQEQVKKSRKWVWLPGLASIAAAILLIFNLYNPFQTTNIVTAMADAFKDVKTYHGSIEIVETNADGQSRTQAILEVWANKEGQYYIKGIDGSHKDLITVNNGDKKWQVQPQEKQVEVTAAFPDAFPLIFDLGKEIDTATQALSTDVIGEGKVAGRDATILEVSPEGGLPYKIWIDQETKLPLQKQYAMHNAMQYTITYTDIDFQNQIPNELMSYNVPTGFSEVTEEPQEFVLTMDEAEKAIGFSPITPVKLPKGYVQDKIAVISSKNQSKLFYKTEDNKQVVLIQEKAKHKFEPVSTAIVGKMGKQQVEIQSPIFNDVGIMSGGGLYANATDISSIRWQQNGYEYAVIGNVSMKALTAFTESVTSSKLEIPGLDEALTMGPKEKVDYDIEIEKNDQKSVDAGSSPWRLDPLFVAHVFANLQMSPDGITGEYPLSIDEFSVVQNTGNEAIIETDDKKSTIKRVYLKKVVRQDPTGIWTVVGYDPAE